MKKTYIILASIFGCTALYIIEQMLVVDYITKTIGKLGLFILMPLIYLKFVKEINIKEALSLKRFKFRSLKMGLILGLASFTIIFIAYFILKDFIDLNAIAEELGSKSKITNSNFLFIGLYITFVNSFLEEFFFRAFIFLNLYEEGYRGFAYLYSSFLFAIYHIGIFKSWFNPALIALALLGLVLVGLVFNWLTSQSKNFLNSWLVHILADSAIIIIGMKMFKII